MNVRTLASPQIAVVVRPRQGTVANQLNLGDEYPEPARSVGLAGKNGAHGPEHHWRARYAMLELVNTYSLNPVRKDQLRKRPIADEPGFWRRSSRDHLGA